MDTNHHLTSGGKALVGVTLAGLFSVGPRLVYGAAGFEADTNVFVRVAGGNGISVKVARQADVWISRDGSNWVQQAVGTRCLLYDVAFGNGLFVVVGNEGTLLTSADGTVWKQQDARTDERLRGITFGNKLFVAVGYAGKIITSKDGTTWKVRNSGTKERLQMVTFDRGNFVALGWRGVTLTSSSGIRWKVRRAAHSVSLDRTAARHAQFQANVTNHRVRPPANGINLGRPGPLGQRSSMSWPAPNSSWLATLSDRPQDTGD